MRTLLLLFLALSAGPFLRAQTTPAATVAAIFDAMRAADTTGLRAHFRNDATLHSVVEKPDGTVAISTGTLDGWFNGIANAGAGDWDEQTPYTEVRQDGHLATAWTPYVFVYKGEVHHCGTNAFQLVRTSADQPWRVLHITDTRRDAPGDCAALSATSPADSIRHLATAWHRAAAEADSAAFFGRMADDAIYIGTDKTEHWTKEEFLGFAAPYFARGKAWAFKATERHVFYDPDRQIAWWDELLDTWMGPCRGTAVVERDGMQGWRIKHYTLSVTVDNGVIEEFMRLGRE